MLKKFYFFVICLLATTLLIAQPANDNCNTATNVSISYIGSSANTTISQTGGTITATASSQASGDAVGKDDDVWFQFTTPNVPVNVSVDLLNITYNINSSQPVIELWDSCTASTYKSWYVFASSANFATLLPNTNYKVRVYTYGSSSRFSTIDFKLTFAPPTPPANNTCSGSVTQLTVNTSGCSNTNGTTIGATADAAGPTGCGSEAASTLNDVWYRFTAPSSGSVKINLSNITLFFGSSSSLAMQLTNSCTGGVINCSTNGELIANGLSSGTTYYIRIYNVNANSMSNFDICATVPPPINDECTGAMALPINSSFAATQTIAGNTLGATISAVANNCTASGGDVWFKFTPTAAQLASGTLAFNISTSSINAALYTGTCGGLTQVSGWCSNSTNRDFPTLTAGTTYYVRAWGAATAYTVSIITNPVNTPPVNDECSGAIDISNTINSGYLSTQNRGAIAGTLQDCFSTVAAYATDVWYTATVSVAGTYLVDIRNLVNRGQPFNSSDVQVQIFTGACGSLTSVLCQSSYSFGSGLPTITQATNTTTTYFIRVITTPNAQGWHSYDIAFRLTNAPTNDNETNDAAFKLVQNLDCTNRTNGTFRAATLSSNPAPNNNAPVPTADVWYTFVASSVNPVITIANTTASTKIDLYTYPASGTAIQSVNGTTMNCSGLTIGSTYSIRLYYTSVSAPTTAFQSNFTICVSGVPTTAAAANVSTCTNASAIVTSTNSGAWLHLQGSGGLVASVFDGPATTGAIFLPRGTISASYFTNTNAIRTDAASRPYLDRNYDITVQNNNLTNSDVRVRFYFTQAEFNTLVSANNSNVINLNDLRFARLSAANCSNIIGSSPLYYTINAWGNFGTNGFYADVIVPNFSGFFLQNVPDNMVLPVTCSNFNYKLQSGNQIRLTWSTLNEINSERFEVEKSFDGINFAVIATINAQGSSTTTTNYSYTNIAKPNEKIYYRLKQTDKNGAVQYVCNTLFVNTQLNAEWLGNVYPNPVQNKASIAIKKMYKGNVEIQVLHTNGKIVQQQRLYLNGTENTLEISTANMATGAYYIRVTTDSDTFTKTISKQ
jgi:hypothetical protein